MKAKLHGFEAVSSGLSRAGVTRIELAAGELNSKIEYVIETGKLHKAVTETLLYAEEAIGRACLFSELGDRSACLIPEDQIYQLLPVMEKAKDLTAPMIVIAFGDEQYAFLDKISLCGMMCWIAGCPEEIIRMIEDAVRYSQISGQPVLLYIPSRILNSSQYCDVNTRFQMGNVTNVSEKRERKIKEKYNKVFSDGEYAVVTGSDMVGMVRRYLYGYDNVAVVQLEMIGSDTGSRLLRRYKRILLIGKNKAVIRFQNSDKRVRELMLGNDFLEWEKRIRTEIPAFLDSCPGISGHKKTEYDGAAVEEPVRVRRPVTEYEDDIMCPGCPFRGQIIDVMAKIRDSTYYEDFFCTKRMTKVKSGVKAGNNRITVYRMGSDVILSNRKNVRYSGRSRIFMFDDICEQRGGIILNKGGSRYCIIIKTKCDSCMDCRKVSGCPAIWSRGLTVHIDSSRCNGCGVCIDICAKGAIAYEKR